MDNQLKKHLSILDVDLSEFSIVLNTIRREKKQTKGRFTIDGVTIPFGELVKVPLRSDIAKEIEDIKVYSRPLKISVFNFQHAKDVINGKHNSNVSNELTHRCLVESGLKPGTHVFNGKKLLQVYEKITGFIPAANRAKRKGAKR